MLDLLAQHDRKMATIEKWLPPPVNQVSTKTATEHALAFLPWTETYRAMLAPGHPFTLANRAYLRQLYEDQHPNMVVEKAAQTGASEYLVGWALWHLDAGHHVLHVMPTDDDVSDFSMSRIGPAIEASPYLAGRLVSGGERGADRVTLKRIGNGFWFLRGGRVKAGPVTRGEEKASQLKSVAADCAILDEYDEIDPRADAFVVERLAASAVGHLRRVSTPTYAGSGIHPHYMASDMMTWHIRCDQCGERQPLTLNHLVREWDDLERPVAWNLDAAGNPALACQRCSGVLDRASAGEWVAAYPGRGVRGYHISRLFVADRPLMEIIAGLRETDDSKRKQIYNQALGLPYRARGSKSLSDEILDACRREYGLGARVGGAFCGIDVGRVLHVVIRGADWSLRDAFEHPDFDPELDEKLTAHGVMVTTIDANPETREARRFQGMVNHPVWLAYYVQGKSRADVEPMAWDEEQGSVKVDRTRAIDAALALFHRGSKREPGGATLPLNARELPSYYAHLKSPQRVMQPDASGNPVAVYTQTGPDHFAHAEVYTYLSAARWLYVQDNTPQVGYDPVRIGNY